MAKKNEEIDITIHEDGQVELETKGYRGTKCADDLKEFTDVIGKVEKVKKKAEFYDREKVRINRT